MSKEIEISTTRLEAFSDGVIAIIITVMVFELKFLNTPNPDTVLSDLISLIPKVFSYAISFIMLAIMWVNHHSLFHQIQKTDNRLIWLNINLLFWMSLIPFGTYFLGSSPFLSIASSLYALIFLLNAFAFTLIRNHILKYDLLHEYSNKLVHSQIKKKNIIAMGLYITAGLSSFISPYISFAIFIIVPMMYFISTNSKTSNKQL